ncbi:MAG: hypothetical protein EZS28_006830 [Streblomastix strix]|uniref:Uncharacterized protein n=1 Tax=Streblomastix strix TaxID=222440 RepID=A0A5J4WRU5_9EUKA|nr:MAG: hypothetical protein EZS28_006830 [Streblomastix strix]
MKYGQTPIEKSLLDVVLSVVEIGYDMAGIYKHNLFYKNISDSGLFTSVKNIFSEEFNKDKREGHVDNSEFTVQLAQIIALINKFKRYETQDLVRIGIVLRSHLKRMFEIMLNNERNESNDQNEQEQQEKQLKAQLGERILTLKCLGAICEDMEHNKYLVQLNIHLFVAHLIHLNCKAELKCRRCIPVRISETTQELQGMSLYVIGAMLFNMDNAKQQIIKDHNLFDHIIPIIISFASNHDSIDQTSQVHDQQQQSIAKSSQSPFPSQSLACGALELLNLFLIETPNIFVQLPSSKSTDLIQSLIKLVRFKSNIHISKKTDMQSMRIRENSSSIFGLIWPHCDEQTEKWIIQDLQLGLKLLKTVSCAGGCLEESDSVTKVAVENLSLIVTIVELGNNDIKANPDLLKLIKEEIIQEDGLNEIESHLFLSKENRDQEIIVDTRRLFMVLNMVRMDITNALIF